jgi:hypothetical protein
MTSRSEPGEPDERLLTAHDVALAALREITPAETVGEPAGSAVEGDGVVSLRFANTMPGYPGWFWTVSVARVEDADPTVLEVELLPGESALVAPEWVPWAERLADYRAQQEAASVLASEVAGDLEDDELDDDGSEDELLDDDELDDVDDDDLDDDDLDGSRILHSGDLDGVDIDELDPSDDDEPDSAYSED